MCANHDFLHVETYVLSLHDAFDRLLKQVYILDYPLSDKHIDHVFGIGLPC